MTQPWVYPRKELIHRLSINLVVYFNDIQPQRLAGIGNRIDIILPSEADLIGLLFSTAKSSSLVEIPDVQGETLFDIRAFQFLQSSALFHPFQAFSATVSLIISKAFSMPYVYQYSGPNGTYQLHNRA